MRRAFAGLAMIAAATTSAATAQDVAVEPVAGTAESGWRTIAPENLMMIETGKGPIVIELNPDFAPRHAERMRELAASGEYEGEHFYRVIEGFVAQGGLFDDMQILRWGPLENENDRPYGGEGFVPLGNDDLFAAEVGHIGGFPVGRDEALDQEWLLHCPGAVALARNNDPDSGGTEIYIVLDAQRYLDRNLTVFGRVIDGMEHVQAFKRGDRAISNGVIQAPEQGEEILGLTIAADLPEDQRPVWRTMTSEGEPFAEHKRALRVRDSEFFYRKPPEVLDICSFNTPAERVAAAADQRR